MNTTQGSLLCVIMLVATPAYFEADLPARIQRVERGLLPPVLVQGDPMWTIEERMKHYKVPGLSIAVINNFRIEWVKTYGLADTETKTPVVGKTLFQAGSISKPVAATVSLKKVEEGKILLEENINNRLTSWKLPDNEFTEKKKVTLAHLLSHTAGLTVHGFPGYAVGAEIPTLTQVLDGHEPSNTAPVRVNMVPGTKHRYSGGGTTIMQLAMMDIEKKPFPEIAKETVFDPLQMSDSTYSQPLPEAIKKMAASGHKSDGRPVAGKMHIYPEMAAAGLWTTPTDLAKFIIELQLSLIGKSNKVLSKEMTAKMLTPYVEDFVGLGFFLDKKGKAIYFQHGGADEGFRAQLMAHKEKGYGAVMMVNSDNGQILNEVLRSVAQEYGWEEYLSPPYKIVSVDSKKLEQYVGRYLVNPDRVLNISREGLLLFAEPTQGPKVEVFPISESTFIRKDADIRYNFVQDAAGRIEKIEIVSNDGKSLAPRISGDVMVPYDYLMSGKFDEAIASYRRVKSVDPTNVAVAEGRLNSLGYALMNQKKHPEAIAVLKLNAELYPESANVYDSLGEAYAANGNKELAIQNYRRALELNPRNSNAARMLKKLEQ